VIRAERSTPVEAVKRIRFTSGLRDRGRNGGSRQHPDGLGRNRYTNVSPPVSETGGETSRAQTRTIGPSAYPPRKTSAAIRAASVGEVPTRTPFASSASFFACAVPDDPVMIAPAWPIVLPGGALKPAI
jgi:hypothetical protein